MSVIPKGKRAVPEGCGRALMKEVARYFQHLPRGLSLFSDLMVDELSCIIQEKIMNNFNAFDTLQSVSKPWHRCLDAELLCRPH